MQRIKLCGQLLSLALLLALVASCNTAAPKSRRDFAKSFDGEKISYAVAGKGDVTLLFVHGWSCDGGYWREQTPVFEKQYRVITMDLAGHGNSGRTRKVYSIDSFAKDVLAVIEASHSDRVILVGHSFGGEIVATAASLAPERVVGVIGVDTLQNVEDWYSQEEAAKLIGIEGFKQDFKAQMKAFVGQMMPKDCDAKLLSWIIEDMASSPPEIGLNALEEYTHTIADKTMLEVFKKVEAPVVCINADQWPTNPEANRRHIKSFDFKIIKGVGHFPMLERPDEFNKLLAESVKEIVGGKLQANKKVTNLAMTNDAKQVVRLIRAAFDGVKLGNGVGLRQGQAIDDYEDKDTQLKYREKDEKEDWSKIPADELNDCYSSLSFFDAEGMRFHLPAFLIADIEGTYRMDVVFHLIYFEHGAVSRFALLSEPQRHAIREYLLLRLAEAGVDEIGFIGPKIEIALADYWTE